MALDPSISLQVKQPDLPGTISNFLDVGAKNLAFQKAQDTYASDVARNKADSSSAQSAAAVNAANVQPLIQQQAAHTSASQTQAQAAAYQLNKDQAQTAMQIAGGLMQDPDFVAGNTDGMLSKLNDARQQMIQSGIPPSVATAKSSYFEQAAMHDPKSVMQLLKNSVLQGQSASQQSSTMNPSTSFVPTAGGTQALNTNMFAPGGVGSMGAPLPSPNSTGTDINGNPVIINTSTGTARAFDPSGGSSGAYGSQPSQGGGNIQMTLPTGETKDTLQTLQNERTAAKQTAMNSGTQHDINRTIIGLIDGGVNTGAAATRLQNLSSNIGFNLDEKQATDYNVLGKMLVRSALNQAQNMGPHTNAGLDAQMDANGTTQFTPAALRKIATLNDALTTGSSLYQQGLENAITANQSVGAKRQFDQQWASALNTSNGVTGVQALRLKNAIDNNDPKEIAAITKEVGGPNSPGAMALRQKALKIDQLSGSQ